LPDPWSIERGQSAAFARCAALEVDGVAHAFGLRHDDAVRSSWFGGGRECRLRQVHGARIVRGSEIGEQGVDADASWDRVERLRGAHLAVRSADCVPILLAARDGSVVAAVHAGWRGTAQRIVGLAVRVLAEQGCDPEVLVAASGPSIGACCYPVSPEVAAAVADASGVALEAIARCESGQVRLDLRAANREQMLAAGIPENSIHLAPWCTACEPDLFFSYRRDGAAAGRQLSLIGPLPGRP
jgi:YfiH family protein